MTYRVFICHAYDHQDIYFSLVQKLNRYKFDWRNQSVQYDMRYGHEDEQLDHAELRRLIGKRISESDALVALTKPIASRRAWLQWEIRLAKEHGIPVIGVARSRNDRVSRFVREHANEIVDTWRIDHITNAIEWLVDDFRERRPKPLGVVPPLQPSFPDEELPIQPSPEAPPAPVQAAIVDAEVEADERQMITPRDVLFPDLGAVVPGRPHVIMPERPRWWQRLTRQLT